MLVRYSLLIHGFIQYDQTYDQNDYAQDPRSDPPEPTTEEIEYPEKTRGRKRIRASVRDQFKTEFQS